MNYMVFFALPTACVISLLLFFASFLRQLKPLGRYRVHLLAMPLAWLATFVFFYILLLIDPNPTWEDNGSIEEITSSDFWRVALLFTLCCQFFIVPIYGR